MANARPKYPERVPCPSRGRGAFAHRGLSLAAAAALSLAVLAGGGGARAQGDRPETGRQLRVGLLHHDLNGYGGTEDGLDVTVELRGARLGGAFWNTLVSPRPHFGVDLNDAGATSSLYAGLTWVVETRDAVYVSGDFGGAVHNGKLEATVPGRAALGSRVLFREAAEVGVRLGERWRFGLRLEHMSNANLAAENDGITNLGIVVTRAF